MQMNPKDVKLLTAEVIASAIEANNAADADDAEETRVRYMKLAKHYGVEKLVLELRHGRNAASS